MEREVLRIAEEEAGRSGLSRRDFLQGPCGVAAALLAVNTLTGCRAYKVDRGLTRDPEAAKAALSGDELIFDAQTHHVDASRGAVWPVNNPLYASMFERINASRTCGAEGRFGCLSRGAYVREIFERSDTAGALLSGVPALLGRNPLDNDEVVATRDAVNERLGVRRVVASGLVLPDVGPRELEGMQELVERHRVVGWTVYTAFAPQGPGWWLDDPKVGVPFLEQARKLKVSRIFCAKGLPWPNFDKVCASPRDVGPAAKAFPDLQFIVHHAGYEADVTEGPYEPYTSPQTADQGVNRLIKSLEENGLWPNQNVYAELGGMWMILMTRPVEAAHVLGKLLKHLGEDRVLWGTDAVFLGSPQPQIEAFRAFEIPEELQDKHGYPALTPAIKEKILGTNAAALLGLDPDELRREPSGGKSARGSLPPATSPEGPRTRRELLRPLLRG